MQLSLVLLLATVHYKLIVVTNSIGNIFHNSSVDIRLTSDMKWISYKHILEMNLMIFLQVPGEHRHLLTKCRPTRIDIWCKLDILLISQFGSNHRIFPT